MKSRESDGRMLAYRMGNQTAEYVYKMALHFSRWCWFVGQIERARDEPSSMELESCAEYIRDSRSIFKNHCLRLKPFVPDEPFWGQTKCGVMIEYSTATYTSIDLATRTVVVYTNSKHADARGKVGLDDREFAKLMSGIMKERNLWLASEFANVDATGCTIPVSEDAGLSIESIRRQFEGIKAAGPEGMRQVADLTSKMLDQCRTPSERGRVVAIADQYVKSLQDAT